MTEHIPTRHGPAFDRLTNERDAAIQRAEKAERELRAICSDFMNQLPTLWGDHVNDGKITVTIDAELVDRIEAQS